ncbi:MAG: glutamine-hydrolyzing carbamoyl-phosphate synthase small subunit [Anaerolineae bacterium]|nr:glutamine-hydrolyzing carbamoyl-phosphate synthase small subunit [Anaerolineae bacterium]
MKNNSKTALLALEDGSAYWGQNVGAPGESFGELVFNTGMTGYQEVLTDPSYCGQIVVMTYPEIGIYGINTEDSESEHIQVAGFVVQNAVRAPSNQRAQMSFTDFLSQAGTIAIEGIDTRALTRHLRTQGAMRGAISTVDLKVESLVERIRQSPQMTGMGLAHKVTAKAVSRLNTSPDTALHIIIIDAGRKENIARDLMSRGMAVTVVPYNTPISELLALQPDGVLVSNGPGDPEPLHETISLMRHILKHRIPLAGICLGHQLLGLALGGKTYKMRFGHRGVNHPVKDLSSGSIVITTQNHGFAVDPTSLGISWTPLDTAFIPQRSELSRQDIQDAPGTMAERLPSSALTGTSPLGFGTVEVTHLSLNDGTVEGLQLLDGPAFSVQYHPEACPGPHDARAFFDQFVELVTVNRTGPVGG